MRGSKRESSEELELDLIEVLEEDEGVEEDKEDKEDKEGKEDEEGGEKLSRTESSKSFESLGEEVRGVLQYERQIFVLFIFYIYLDGTGTVGSEEE